LFKDKIVERDNSPWTEDRGVISRKDLLAVNAMLFLNKSNVRGALPQDVNQHRPYAQAFWNAISKIPSFASPQAKLKTVAAQAVMLKTLAKLAYNFGLGRSSDEVSLQKLINGIPSIDFNHDNPMWRYGRLSDDDRARLCPGLSDYLRAAYVEVGTYDETQPLFKFSPLHNDIMPVVGDMIRWALKLPNRHE
jgi:hypothetical protein